MRPGLLLPAIVAFQVLCSGVFFWNVLSSLLGLPPVDWALYELIEIGAAVGLLIGTAMGAVLLRRNFVETARVHRQLRIASGAFREVLEDQFTAWGLTPAERDVALFVIKGMSTAEIAGLRQTSEGTVKAQTNAIYRKAGVSGRPQLLSLFIDELMSGPLETRAAAE